jgi:hypothetical protein
MKVLVWDSVDDGNLKSGCDGNVIELLTKDIQLHDSMRGMGFLFLKPDLITKRLSELG